MEPPDVSLSNIRRYQEFENGRDCDDSNKRGDDSGGDDPLACRARAPRTGATERWSVVAFAHSAVCQDVDKRMCGCMAVTIIARPEKHFFGRNEGLEHMVQERNALVARIRRRWETVRTRRVNRYFPLTWSLVSRNTIALRASLSPAASNWVEARQNIVARARRAPVSSCNVQRFQCDARYLGRSVVQRRHTSRSHVCPCDATTGALVPRRTVIAHRLKALGALFLYSKDHVRAV